MIDLLLENDGDINAVDINGNSALIIAITKGGLILEIIENVHAKVMW